MENAHNAETDSSDRRAGKPKKRRQPENLGSLAVVSERVEPAPGHIGHMLMSAEAKPSDRAGKTAPETAKPAKETFPADHLLANRRIETMNRRELLDLSEQVVIDGSSLGQIYETHLVGERGLRRLMVEYQHGGDLKKALRREIIEREIDFERDPAVRDMATYQTDSAAARHVADRTALNDLLEQAAQTAEDRNEETAFFKARARYEARELHQHKQRRRVVDFSLAAVILILLLLIILLFMKRL